MAALAVALLPAASAPACGCGVMIPSDPSDLEGHSVEEWSIVRWDGRREDITMRLESSTAFERAALIMPVPAPAEFALGHDAVFDDMTERTKPRVVKRTKHVLFGRDDDGAGGDEGAAPTAGAGGVEVVDAQDLGPLRLVTLRGDDAAVVAAWLSDHGFAAPAGLEAIAQDYLDDDWLLVAVRLRGAGGAEVRRLQPLIISFDSPRLVYPLRMSALADGPVEARVDAVAPGPLAVRGWPRRDLEPDAAGSGRLFAGPEANGRYLTSYRFAIDGDDFPEPEFVAAARSDFRQTVYVDEEVDITGRVAGATAGGLAILVLTALLVARRRRRA